MDTEKPLNPDAQYVVGTLFPELEKSFREWGKEYQQERDLGPIGEFVGLYRKSRKLKTVFIDGVDPSDWRESVRTIAMEVAAHALLLVRDLDNRGNAPFAPTPAPGSVVFDAKTNKYWLMEESGGWAETCGPECDEGHTYLGTCIVDGRIGKPLA